MAMDIADVVLTNNITDQITVYSSK